MLVCISLFTSPVASKLSCTEVMDTHPELMITHKMHLSGRLALTLLAIARLLSSAIVRCGSSSHLNTLNNEQHGTPELHTQDTRQLHEAWQLDELMN